MDTSSNVSIDDLLTFSATTAAQGNRVDPKQNFFMRIDADIKLAQAGELNGYMYKQRAENRLVVTPMNGARKMKIKGKERFEAPSLDIVIKILELLRKLGEQGDLDEIFAEQTAPSKAFRA